MPTQKYDIFLPTQKYDIFAESASTFDTNYQSLLPHVQEGIRNAFWSMSNFSLQT